MGFFGSLGKVLSGKPVFEPKQSQGELKPAELAALQANQTDTALGPVAQQNQTSTRRTPPVVRVGRVENQVSGGRLDVYADIRNESAEPIFLDRILLLGVVRQLDAQLQPGQTQQFVVYSGQLFANEPRGYAEVQYRTAADGDYFSDRHEIRSRQEGANGYYITECLLRGPVKDV